MLVLMPEQEESLRMSAWRCCPKWTSYQSGMRPEKNLTDAKVDAHTCNLDSDEESSGYKYSKCPAEHPTDYRDLGYTQTLAH